MTLRVPEYCHVFQDNEGFWISLCSEWTLWSQVIYFPCVYSPHQCVPSALCPPQWCPWCPGDIIAVSGLFVYVFMGVQLMVHGQGKLLPEWPGNSIKYKHCHWLFNKCDFCFKKVSSVKFGSQQSSNAIRTYRYVQHMPVSWPKVKQSLMIYNINV